MKERRSIQLNIKTGYSVTHNIADYTVFEKIILEIKSTVAISDAHSAQALSYLAVSGLKVALVINFGERSLTWKRIVL